MGSTLEKVGRVFKRYIPLFLREVSYCVKKEKLNISNKEIVKSTLIGIMRSKAPVWTANTLISGSKIDLSSESEAGIVGNSWDFREKDKNHPREKTSPIFDQLFDLHENHKWQKILLLGKKATWKFAFNLDHFLALNLNFCLWIELF